MEPLLPAARVESSSCWAQLRVLLWKQRLQASRNLRATIAIVLSPVAVCLILSAFQLMSNSVLDRAVPFPSAAPISALPRAIASRARFA